MRDSSLPGQDQPDDRHDRDERDRASTAVTPAGDEPPGTAPGSGKQFERGTQSAPEPHPHDPGAEPAVGGGAAAGSGKQFARGTDASGGPAAHPEDDDAPDRRGR